MLSQALDVVQQSKIAEVLGGGEVKDPHHQSGSTAVRGVHHRRRSRSRDRLDNVAYDARIHGDEVSISLQWSGDGVSRAYVMHAMPL